MVPEPEIQVVSTLSASVLKQRALGALGKLPPFSPILNKLLDLLAGGDVCFTKLGDLIEKDTVVAGNVLHLVNSAPDGRSTNINSVRHALSILGLDKVRSAVLSMSIWRMWNQTPTPAGWSMARFNRHSASVAILSDLMAQGLTVVYAEGAFVAGLLHDIGRLLIALSLPAEFERLLHRYTHTDHPWVECEQEVLGFAHAELSAEALDVWKLPEPIRVAVRDHHNPASFQSDGAVPLSRVVDAANRYVNSMGESILTQQKNDASGAAWIESFGLAPDAVARLLADFETEHKAMAQFFS